MNNGKAMPERGEGDEDTHYGACAVTSLLSEPISETTKLIATKEGVNQFPAWAFYLIIVLVFGAIVASVVIAFVVQKKTKTRVAMRAATASRGAS